MNLNSREWYLVAQGQGQFLNSTRIELLDREFINAAFASDDMYWAASLSPDDLEVMLAQSVTFGLYRMLPRATGENDKEDEPSSPRDESPTLAGDESPPLEPAPSEDLEQVGMARLITDHVTFAYLTDVYISPEHRGGELAKWLIKCVKEVMQAHPRLRRFMLLTGTEHLIKYYERELGAWNMLEEPTLTVMSGKFKKS